MKRHTKEEKAAILKQQGNGTMQQLADKTGVGLSTLTSWKAQLNHKPKRKVKVVRKKRKKIEGKGGEEGVWKGLFDKYIYHRDEAAKAKKELEAFVEKLR